MNAQQVAIGKDSHVAASMARARRWLRTVATLVVFVGIATQGFRVQAELVFRSLQQTNGQPTWSGLKRYSNTADISYPQNGTGRLLAPVDEVRVYLSGEITRKDLDSAVVMERLVKSGQQRLSNNTLWLGSGGGDIDAGMDIGRLLRKLGIFTFVDKSDRCNSACVFAFMGGERRSVAGQLGIHRPYFPYTQDLPDRAARFRHLAKTVKDFVDEMDFPASLYEAVMLVPPESIQVVSAADLKRFYLEGISPSSEDKADAAAARRLDLPMLDYLKRKARTPPCSVLDIAYGQCAGNQITAKAGTPDQS
ncbi:hypothetical protein [Rhodoferax sp.]|uniref:COG3904 family protein n=1 Tax=Rhodoferax sp. TaxID=50421 RepID=UPI00274669A6|nr:hypothetical protein [Rhodoferax sp.]